MSGRKAIGFGVPDDIDPHHFEVAIPAARSSPVVITEHFGLAGGSEGLPDSVERCHLPQPAWNAIRKDVERVLNERLKEKNLPTARWKTGKNQVERLLGRELCLLAWGIETARMETIPNAVRTWGSLKPEERWWLFSMAASLTGTARDTDVGWRKAVRIALTENPGAADITAASVGSRSTRPQLPLFD